MFHLKKGAIDSVIQDRKQEKSLKTMKQKLHTKCEFAEFLHTSLPTVSENQPKKCKNV